MTDADMNDRNADEAQRARVEALRQRRAPRVNASASASPAAEDAPTSRPTRRRHVAGRSRVGVAAFSVATMFGLVGVMGLARPASSATPTAPGTTTPPAPMPTSTPDPVATTAPGPATAAPPVALTARPRVQVTTPPTVAPVARTNGSH